MTNENTVSLDEKTYHATVEQNNKPPLNHTSSSEELSYESTKAEYEHCVQRSQKLDNKVYIILTVDAFLSVILYDIINGISDFSFPKSHIQLALLIIYSILLALNVFLYVLTLIQLTHLLKGVAIERFEPLKILEKEMIMADPKAVAKYICSRYNQCINTNNNILEIRFKKFNRCVNYMISIIIISIVLMFISNFIL